ncbi:tetratricopeptide repeat protein [Sorangium sp. So ce1097]|uniref:tetratricopeptide repeat protein n=1 Tax=Sorangium sp. So ce1097 TaxID=3133330 RepID=UPI003F63C5F4
MERRELDGLTREELIARAEGLGVPRPRVLTKAELVDEILARATQSEPERARLRGFLGRARDLLSRVVERGLHMPETARALRGEPPPEEQWPPPPPPPLPTTTLAEIYAAQGHTDRAIAVLDEILARAPHHEEARQLRARLIEEAQRAQEQGAGAQGAKAAEDADEDEEDAGEEDAGEEDAGEEGAGAVAAGAQEAKAAGDVGAEAADEKDAGDEGAAAEDAGAQGAEAADAEAADAEAATGAAPEVAAVESPETPGSGALIALIERPTTDEQAGQPEAASEAPAAAPAPSPRELPPAEPPAQAPPAAEDGGEGAALALAAVVQDERAELPARYDVDEIVGLAVDPETLYLYWEVRPKTLARARARRPEGHLVVRVVAVLPSWERPVVEQRDLAIDALFGDMFVRDVPAGAHLRMCTGWLAGDVFEPFAVGLEVAAPRALPVAPWPAPAEPVALETEALPGESPPDGSTSIEAEPHAEGRAGAVSSPAPGVPGASAAPVEPPGAGGEGGTPAGAAASAAPAPSPGAPAPRGGDAAADVGVPAASGNVVAEAAAPAAGRDVPAQAAAPAAGTGAPAQAAAFEAGDAPAAAVSAPLRDAAVSVPLGDAAVSAPHHGPAVDVGTSARSAPSAGETGRPSPGEEPPRFPSGTVPAPEAIAHAVAVTRGAWSEGPPRFPSGTVPTPEAIAQAVAATRGGASELGRGSGGGAGPGHGGPAHASEALRRAGAGGAPSLGGGSELRASAAWARPLGGGSELWRSFAARARPPSGSR